MRAISLKHGYKLDDVIKLRCLMLEIGTKIDRAHCEAFRLSAERSTQVLVTNAMVQSGQATLRVPNADPFPVGIYIAIGIAGQNIEAHGTPLLMVDRVANTVANVPATGTRGVSVRRSPDLTAPHSRQEAIFRASTVIDTRATTY